MRTRSPDLPRIRFLRNRGSGYRSNQPDFGWLPPVDRDRLLIGNGHSCAAIPELMRRDCCDNRRRTLTP